MRVTQSHLKELYWMWCPPTYIIIVCGNIYNIYMCAYVPRISITLILNVPIYIAAIPIVWTFWISFVPGSIAPILIFLILISTMLITPISIRLIWGLGSWYLFRVVYYVVPTLGYIWILSWLGWEQDQSYYTMVWRHRSKQGRRCSQERQAGDKRKHEHY